MNDNSHNKTHKNRNTTPILKSANTRHIVTLCSPCRTECGYCHGDRLSVLVHDNPHPSPPGEQRPCILAIEQQQTHGVGREEKQRHGHQKEDRHDGHHHDSPSSKDASCSPSTSLSNTNDAVVIQKHSTSDAYALHFETISPNAYLTLINRGWRRSGKLLYLPRNWSSCCPAIPIRLEATRFQISKSQKKLVSKFQRCFNWIMDDAHDAASHSNQPQNNGLYHDKVNGRGRGQEGGTVPAQDHHKRQKYHSLTMPMFDVDCPIANNNHQPFLSYGTHQESSSIPPVQFQKQSCRASDDVKQIIQCRAKQVVLQDDLSLISFLKDTLRCQVNKILLDLGQINSNNNSNDSIEQWNKKLQSIQNKMDKLCSWKCTKVSKPQPRLDAFSTDNTKDDMSDANSMNVKVVDVTLSNTVGPALRGMTGGMIDQMVIARKLVSSLRETLERHKTNHGEKELYETLALKGVSIGDVTCHEPSGHIHVVVRVRVEWDDNCDLKRDQKDTPMRKKGPIVWENDILGQFISSTLNHSKGSRDQYDLSPPYRISVKSVPSNISCCMPQVHRLYCKYQHAIHGDDDPYCTEQGQEFPKDEKHHHSDDDASQHDNDNSDEDKDKNDERCNHDVSQKMKKEKLKELYPEYDKHQINKIYKNYDVFYRFLCSTPLPHHAQNMKKDTRHSLEYSAGVSSSVHQSNVSNKSGAQNHNDPFHIQDADVTIPFGSYHQHYLINDKYLFAVGVVNILPQCLSSVYSFYDPELSRTLNLGKITALYEIEWVKRAMRFRQDLRYYYLGYYIHSCQKMKYKAQFKPSELLCPVRSVWVDFEEAEKRLEDRSPIRHCCNISTPDEEYFRNDSKGQICEPKRDEKAKESVVNRVLFDIGAGTYLTLNMVTDEAKEIIYPLLESLVEEVGNDIASECVVKLC
jgi:Putative arginyl-tRNA:protein arginylyltransferase